MFVVSFFYFALVILVCLIGWVLLKSAYRAQKARHFARWVMDSQWYVKGVFKLERGIMLELDRNDADRKKIFLPFRHTHPDAAEVLRLQPLDIVKFACSDKPLPCSTDSEKCAYLRLAECSRWSS